MSKKKVKKKKAVKRASRISGVPKLVKVISILYYIISVLTIVTGIVLFFGGIIGGNYIARFGIDEILKYGAELSASDAWAVPLLTSSLIVGGIIVIALGIIELLIGRGLWRGRSWARYVAIAIAVLGFISALFTIDIIALIISGMVGGYLWFNKNVKLSFIR